MIVKDISELKGCIRDDIPCKFLRGSLSLKPLMIFCLIGQNCASGYCCYHLDNEDGLTVDEIIKREQGK